MSNTIDLAKNRMIFWYKVVMGVICRNMVVNQQVAIRIGGGTISKRKDKIDRKKDNRTRTKGRDKVVTRKNRYNNNTPPISTM